MTKYKIIIGIIFIISLCGLSYQLGKSNAKVQIITKEVEVIKYVKENRKTIQAQPNASRDELLKLMRESKL